MEGWGSQLLGSEIQVSGEHITTMLLVEFSPYINLHQSTGILTVLLTVISVMQFDTDTIKFLK